MKRHKIKLLYFADIKDLSFFKTQKFFINTEDILLKLGFDIIVTNRISDSWKMDYDGLFCFFFKWSSVASLVAKFRGKKVFFTGGLDDLDSQYAPPLRYFRQVLTFKICRWMADFCLVESHADMSNINKVCLIKNHKNLYYSPQGIDFNIYRCDIQEKQPLFSTICWMGETSNPIRKGVDVALFYFKFLKTKPEFKDYKFVIMGKNGPGFSYIEQYIKQLQIEDSVIYTGEVSEAKKINILKKTRFFFQLSRTEGFGLAALEAMAAHCIPIHSGKGGLKDVLSMDGILINIDNFNYTMDSIEFDVYDRLLEITTENLNSYYTRIQSQFDEKVRENNFRETILRSFE